MRSSNQRTPPQRRTSDALDRVLQLALDATGAERAFLVRAAARHEGPWDPVVEARHSRRGDGQDRPSRSLSLAALRRDAAFLSTDLALDPRLATETSVRALELRFVVTAPVSAQPDARRALVLDGRAANGTCRTADLLAVARGLGALIDTLSVDGRRETPATPAIDGRCGGVRRMRDWIARVAATRLPVLVCGETGSGKEAVARAIHRASARSSAAWVACNCTAFAEGLLEAELFGCVRGAYTGSERDRRGLFEQADCGTLLLDEVGDMPAAMQAKLLRTLEEGCVRPVGAESDRAVDVRVVAATHRDLAREVREGRFRADLYHRLAVFEVRVPPLRERLSDLPILIEGMRPRLERETGLRLPPPGEAVLARLQEHSWPGNVRELHAVLARAMLRAQGKPLSPVHLESFPRSDDAAEEDPGTRERRMIRAALAEHRGSVTEAAGAIGWSRQKLYRRMKALSL